MSCSIETSTALNYGNNRSGSVLPFYKSFFSFLIPLFLLFLTSSSSAQVVINEIGIAPKGGTNGSGGEFVELMNKGTSPVNIGCHVLVFRGTSGAGKPTGWTVTMPSGTTIAPGGYFLIGGLGLQSPQGQTWASLAVGGTNYVNAYGEM